MLTNHFRIKFAVVESNFSSLETDLLRFVIEDLVMESDREASVTDSGRIIDNFIKESDINSEPKSNILNVAAGKSYTVYLCVLIKLGLISNWM